MKKNSLTPVHFSFFTKKEQNTLAKLAFSSMKSKFTRIEDAFEKPIDKVILKKLHFCSHLPFLREIYLVNSYSFGVHEPGDYDLLLVIKEGRLFLGRLCVSLVFHFLRKRRHGERQKNRFCLSFWAVEGEALQKYHHKDHIDLYFMLWGQVKKPILYRQSFLAKSLEKLLSWSFLEMFAEKLQVYKFQRNAKKLKRLDGIVINKRVLKFHNEDKRRDYYDLWMQTLKKEDRLLYNKIKLYETSTQ